MDSRFHGSDGIEILDSRFHGNDRKEELPVEVLASRFLHFLR